MQIDTIRVCAVSYYGLPVIDIEGTEYLVASSEKEALLAVKEYITQNIWSFNSDFIVEHTELHYQAIKMIDLYQQEEAENSNDVLLSLITDLDEFVEDAVQSDGLGHFFNSYDCETYTLKDIPFMYWGQVLGALGLSTKNVKDVLLFRIT